MTAPINQVSQQLNSVVMALAGAKRIFELMDQEPEKDEGYVTLVNAKYVDGVLTETEEKTEMWAWKYPHHDGRLEYVEVKGYIEMTNVDFGYEENPRSHTQILESLLGFFYQKHLAHQAPS